MPINADHEFITAEKKYLQAQTLEEKIACLQDMIRKAPGHKGAENLRAELKTRLKKLKEKSDKVKKSGKGKKSIRKEGFQIVLVGKTNSGKSMLLSKLTNASPKISNVLFTTVEPEVGAMHFRGVKAQVIDLPSIGSKEFDYNIVNTADCLLLVVDNLSDLKEINDELKKTMGKKIIVVNKIDLLKPEGLRKLEATCKSKRLNYVLISAKNGDGLDNLKGKILGEMGVIRIFTKEPGKPKNEDPVALPVGSTVKDVAETIYKGFSDKIKETRLTGPSGKFANQRVGLNHRLKDMDVIEFKEK